MTDLCCICLETIDKKSYFQKCLERNKLCSCYYKIHNGCLFKYMEHKLSSKENITCIVCKSSIISYDSCILLTNSVIEETKYTIENMFFFIKLIFLTILVSSFLNICRQVLA